MAVKFVTGVILDEAVDLSKDVFRAGARCKEGNDQSILIKFNNGSGNEDAAIGQFLCGFDSAGSYEDYEGTNDLNDSDAVPNLPWGQMMAAPDDGEGVWCRYLGHSDYAAVTDGTAAEGGAVVLASATVGGIKQKAALTEREVGVALQDDVVNELAAGGLFINIPL